MVSTEKKTAILMTTGAILVVVGAILVVFWPAMFMSQLQKMMILTERSQSFEIWRETPIPMFLEFHMFNISNVDEILAGHNVKLRINEMGPYVFRESHLKTNLTWNENATVTFFNQRWWHFVPEMSGGSLSDEITTINPVIVTAAYQFRHESPLIRFGMNLAMRAFHSNMFVTANASSWLFEGIEDPLIEFGSLIPNSSISIPYDRFGWFYTRNGSATFDGTFLMNTGARDFSQLGNIEKWRHSNRTHYRGECGEVKGSTGELWAPELGQEEVYIFASDICTYLILHKNDSVTVEGVEGVMYAANDSVFDNGHHYPHMACYCDDVDSPDCVPSGALNASACQLGAPAFVSLPHFLHSDPYYPSKIDGLEPKDEYKFRIALEMYTGMPLEVSAQLQINLLVRHIDEITLNNELPDNDIMVPMFWFRQEMQTTPEYAALARYALNVKRYMPIAFYGLTGIGILVLVSGVIILVRKLLHSPDTAPIVTDDNLENSQ